MIPNLIIWNSFLEDIFSGLKRFFICRDISVDIIRVSFLISDFLVEILAESLKTIYKTWQKISHILQYSFAQKTSLILRTSACLTLKIICSRNAAKNHSDFTNLSANMFLFGARKLFCTAPFLDAQELHS